MQLDSTVLRTPAIAQMALAFTRSISENEQWQKLMLKVNALFPPFLEEESRRAESCCCCPGSRY